MAATTEISLKFSESGGIFWLQAMDGDGDMTLGAFLAHDNLPIQKDRIATIFIKDVVGSIVINLVDGKTLEFSCYEPTAVPMGLQGVVYAMDEDVVGATAYAAAEFVIAKIYDKLNWVVPV